MSAIQGCVAGSSQRTAPFRAASNASRRSSRVRAANQAPRCSANSSDQQPTLLEAAGRAAAALALSATLALSTGVAAPPQLAPQAQAGLVSSDPVKNARALLRNALPVNNKPIRQIQASLESIPEQLRVPGSKPLAGIERSTKKAINIAGKERAKIVAAFAPDKKDAGLAALDELDASLKALEAVLAAGDKQAIPDATNAALAAVGAAEEAMVQGFPFEVPAEYADLPQLKGRASMDMEIVFKDMRENGTTGGTMRIVVDGFNAPISAGNFVDLGQRGFYDTIEVERADGFVVQFGDPEGPADGFVDPATGKVRRIPFEVMVQGDKVPVYEITLEENGRFNEQPVLPFNAFGTMAVARGEFDTNSGSSQVFFLLKESELTPTGSNLLDGRYAVFGYIVDNYNLLKDIKVGDKIVQTKLLSGAENLQQPK